MILKIFTLKHFSEREMILYNIKTQTFNKL